MVDPVTCADGHTYEKVAIERWFATGSAMSPATGVLLPHKLLIPNHALRNAIEEWAAGQGGGKWAAAAADVSTAAEIVGRVASTPEAAAAPSAAPSVRHDGKVLTHALLALRDVPGIGRGWFATRDLEAGTELWSEKPISRGRNRADLVRRVDADLPKHAAFCRPTASEDSEGEGIVRCNYFDNGALGAMLFERTSLLNHACCPNASVRMIVSEYGGCSSRVVAARRVLAGEQCTISYSAAKLFRHRDERPCRAWGFGECPRCQGALPPAEQEVWTLLEAAAAAADRAKGLKPSERTVEAAMAALPLQIDAAEALAGYLPYLDEGSRFEEDVVFFRTSV